MECRPAYLRILMLLLAVSMSSAQSTPTLPLMPIPASIHPGPGGLLIDKSFSVSSSGCNDAVFERATGRFLPTLSRQTGIFFLSGDKTEASLVVTCARAGDPQKLGEDESYRLQVSASSARIEAPTSLGSMHGLQTFLQLVHIGPQGFAAGALTIEDRPRFPWRGSLAFMVRWRVSHASKACSTSPSGRP